MIPLAIAGIQAGLGLVQGIAGMVRSNQAKKTLEELAKNRPYNGVPSAWEKLAQEPISAQYRAEQERLGQRGLGTALGTMGKGGARTLGLANRALQTTQDATTQRYAQYDQARINALQGYAGAQEAAMNRRQDVWNTIAQGAQQARSEGFANAMTGLGNVGMGLAYGVENWPTGGGGIVNPNTMANVNNALNLKLNTPKFP